MKIVKKFFYFKLFYFYYNFLFANESEYEYNAIKLLTVDYFLKIFIILFILSIFAGVIFLFVKNKKIKYISNNKNIVINEIKVLMDDKKIIDINTEKYKYIIFISNNYGFIIDKFKIKKAKNE